MTPHQENWRTIPTFPDYEASDLGRIRSYRYGRPCILKGWVSGNGYRYVKLTRDRVKKDTTVHSLVADAFHGPRPAGLEIRHLDGDRLNNEASNLLYGTASENRYDSVRHGTHHMVARRQRAA